MKRTAGNDSPTRVALDLRAHGVAVVGTNWSSAPFTTAGALRRLFRDAGATAVHTRSSLYSPPWGLPGLVRRAEAIERLGRPLGALGAAFVVARAEVVRPAANR